MKTKLMIVTLLLALLYSTTVSATDDKYKEAMIKNIKLVYEAKDVASYQGAANTFERISAAEPSRWEAYYYTAFAYVMMSNIEPDLTKKDSYLDLAMQAVSKGRELVPAESELAAIEGFIYMLRIPIDPATRGMKFAPQAMKAFENAVALNPNNPRAVAMKAQMEFGTAQFFGNGTQSACALNASALEKFSTFVPADELTPTWGKSMAESLVGQCK
jgi:hypothetical protein